MERNLFVCALFAIALPVAMPPAFATNHQLAGNSPVLATAASDSAAPALVAELGLGPGISEALRRSLAH